MAGFGHNRKATGVHDPLMARAVVLQHGKTKIALASVDLVGFFRPNVENVRKQLDGFTYVLVSSTHNHEGPDTLGLWGPTPLQNGVDAAYVKSVEEQIVAAIKMADGAKKPATAKIGSEKAPELLHDAREPFIKHDELVALEFRDRDDKCAGLVVQWNCHPETLDSKNKQLSADFVGYTVKHLHDKYRCPVVYLTGTVGGLMTSLHVEIKSPDGKKLADGSFEKTERYGQLLGEAAERALKKAKPIKLTPLEAKARPLFLPVDNKLYLVARQIGVFKREAFLWKDDPYKAEPLKPADAEKRQCIKTELGLLRLGEVEIAAIPGEIYPELVLDKVQDPVDPGADFPDAPIEPAIYKQMKGPHRMIVGLANDEVGYIIPKRQWDEKPPFCYGRQKAQYGEGNSLGPETAPLLCKAFQELVATKKCLAACSCSRIAAMPVRSDEPKAVHASIFVVETGAAGIGCGACGAMAAVPGSSCTGRRQMMLPWLIIGLSPSMGPSPVHGIEPPQFEQPLEATSPQQRHCCTWRKEIRLSSDGRQSSSSPGQMPSRRRRRKPPCVTVSCAVPLSSTFPVRSMTGAPRSSDAECNRPCTVNCSTRETMMRQKGFTGKRT